MTILEYILLSIGAMAVILICFLVWQIRAGKASFSMTETKTGKTKKWGKCD